MKKKLLKLLLLNVLVLSLTSCGCKNTKQDSLMSEVYSLSTATETIEEDTTAASVTHPVVETSQADETTTTKEQTVQPETVQEQQTKVVIIDATEAETLPQNTAPVNSTMPDTYPNSFRLITLTEEDKNTLTLEKYLGILEKGGAVYVSSAEEALALFHDTCAKSEVGMNIYFNRKVNVELIKMELPQNAQIGSYIDVNLYEYSTYSMMIDSDNCDYFGVQLTWWTSQIQEAQLNEKVAQITSGFGGTTYDKIKASHDYICNHVDYCYNTENGTDNNYSAYNAVFEGKSVCQGYALAFQKFMDQLGIECYIAKGFMDGVNHAWNIVKLDETYYYVDCTWDGQDTATYYDYFLKGYNSYNTGNTSWGGLPISPVDY